MNLLWIALVMGITGGVHCAAMCGPVVLALPGNKWTTALLYNAGRTMSYVLLGLAVALAGLPVKWLLGTQWFSLSIGILIIFVAFMYLTGTGNASSKGFIQKNIRGMFKRIWNISPVWSPLLIGMLNGLLPCGLLYMALISSAGMPNLFLSAMFMLIFSLSTWPALWMIWIFGNKLKSKLGKNRKWVSFAFTFLFGLLIITRGMNLGIPMMSPEIVQKECVKLKCCEK